MRKSNIPVISDAESQVMEALWQHAPQGSEELATTLHASTGWHENTVRTLLKRLVDKGAVSATREGRRFLYAPLLTREQWQTSESRSLLDRLFGGRVAPLVAHFSEHEKLSEKDIADLRHVLDEIEHREKGKRHE